MHIAARHLNGWLTRQPTTWRAEVFGVALVCACIATAVDTYLLDRKLGLFTGGYLAEYRIVGVRTLLFLALSVLVDVALLAPLVAAVLWISRWLRLHAAARIFLAGSAALGAVAVADVAVYELQRYFGDLLNLEVLVSLVDGDIREILHFGVDPALHWFGILSLGALVVLGVGLWLDRWFPTRMRQDPGARRRTFRSLLVVLSVAVAVSASLRLADAPLDRAFRYKPTGRVLGSITQWLTDIDRDGYGLLSIPADPDAFRASVRPYALDVPGNGIDDNGIGGDLRVGGGFVERSYPPVRFSARPDVVFVILESFRADAVGRVQNGVAVTPTLDALARQGMAVPHAYSHNGFTVQSRYHAFTGYLLPRRSADSVIDDFNSNGYETAFFSAQDESFGSHMNVGYERAKVRYDARVDRDRRFTRFATPASLTVSFEVLEERLNEFLQRRDPATPLFLHVNLQDGHYPYTNPDVKALLPYRALANHEIRPEHASDVRNMYLNTLANVDRALGRILHKVALTTGRPPAMMVIADHGESLFDQGFLGHGYAINDAQTHIPFIVAGMPAEVPAVVGQVDVRGILRDALSRPGTTPRLSPRAGHVFQYIGPLGSPRELGWVDGSGRVTVDLRSGRWSRDGEAWRRLEGGTVETGLIHFWERLLLAGAR